MKVLLPLATFSALLLLYLYGYWMPRSLANIEAGSLRSIEQHMDSVAEGLVPLLLGHQLDTIYENLDSLKKKNSDWLSIRLLDADGRPLYPLAPSPLSPTDRPPEKDIHVVSQRIRFFETELGLLVLTVDFAPRLSEVRERHWELMSVMLGIIVLFTITAGWVLDRMVRRPVNLLARASQRLAEGDFDLPLMKAGGDEIGILVDSFDGMRIAIREYRATLQSTHEQLRTELVERRQAEEDLRQMNERFSLATTAARLGVWDWDVRNNDLHWDEGMYKLYGIKEEDFAGAYEAWLQGVHPDDRGPCEEVSNDALRGERAYDTEFRVRWPDGSIHYLKAYGQIVRDPAGSPLRMTGINFDITERKKTELINAGRMHLIQFAATHSLPEILEETLNKTEEITGSLIGFYHFYDTGQSSLTLQAWSTRTKIEFCTAEGAGLHYDMQAAGMWADAARQRRPVVHNNYAALPQRKGLPSGHPAVVRELVVPVMRGNQVLAILGVGNKPSKYTAKDIESVSYFADFAWDVAERKMAEMDLHKLNEELEQRVKDRTAELEQKNRELERFNKLFVGRELQMIKLKERIKELEQKIRA